MATPTTFTTLPRQIEEALERLDLTTTRREFLKSSGLFVLSVSGAGAQVGAAPGAAEVPPAYPDPDFLQLDSWIVIHEDGTATFFVGKTDGGQGTGTAFRQMMCDELDLAYDQATLVMGSTDVTVDQGGSGGSDGIQTDGPPMRRVAAEARRALLEMAGERFGVPVDRLTVRQGVISLRDDPSRRVGYGELVGGRRFNVTLTGRNINAVTGAAPVKTVQQLEIVGQPIDRFDIPSKVDGSHTWAVDARVPGMVHARNVKPPFAGARLVSVDESSVSGLPGFVRVVTRGNYVAVVFQREEQAIRGARQLQARWEKPAEAPFPSSERLFDWLRGETPSSYAPTTGTRTEPDPVARVTGDPDGALARAAVVVEARYDVPFQGHTAIGPAHAMADPSDGQMTIYSNDMKSYGLRTGVADFLGIPREQVRVVYMDGPQLYGRTAADDAGFEAAFLARELGRPVRVQWMRDEETAWDAKGPAFAFDLRGALDAQGNVIAVDYRARVADYAHIGYNEPETVLIAQLMGARPERPQPGGASPPAELYAIPNRRQETHVVRFPLAFETPLRTGNLRDPNGPQTSFAGESFIDELAAAARADPVELRLRLLRGSSEDDAQFKRARSIAVVEAAAREYGWEPRPAPTPLGAGRVLTGRGIAYCYRGQTVVAEIAEVEVDRVTGHVWVKRLVCAHDCGLVINPKGLVRTLEGNMMHGLSRALHEEVVFDGEKVTSVDWVTHPTLRHADAPERIDVVIVNGDPNPDRADLPHYGAGEAAIRPTIAAVANAIFDATGVRIRRVPFRDDRVLAALRAAGV
jgi:CO/xanthine dehydrogenase Mo-binding subunit